MSNKKKKKEKDEERAKAIKAPATTTEKKEGITTTTNPDLVIKSNLNFKEVFLETSWKNRSLLAVSQAGLVNNLIFGVSWGLFTLYFVSFGISVFNIFSKHL